jgi:hypothetical protein
MLRLVEKCENAMLVILGGVQQGYTAGSKKRVRPR